MRVGRIESVKENEGRAARGSEGKTGKMRENE